MPKSKGISTPGSAYETFPNVTTADEAAKQGLAVVEHTFAGGVPVPVYGRYLDSETGAPIEMLANKPGESYRIAAGNLPKTPILGNEKGSLLSPGDPVIHGSSDVEVHADGSPAFEGDPKADEALLAAGASGPAAPVVAQS